MNEEVKSKNAETSNLKKVVALLMFAWSIVIFILLSWNLFEQRKTTLESAAYHFHGFKDAWDLWRGS